MFELIDTLNFNETPVTAMTYQGKPCVPMQDVAAAIGYEQPRKLRERINGSWSDDFVEGEDFIVVTGDDLKDLGACTGLVHANSRSMMLLTEDGVLLAAMMSRTKVSTKFRRWAKKVLCAVLKGEPVPRPELRPDPRAEREARLLAREERLARKQRSDALRAIADLAAGWVDARVVNAYKVQAAEIETGLSLLPLKPADVTPTYLTAGDIAKALGVSAAMVGRVTNALGLKDSDRSVPTISVASNGKQVTQWTYHPDCVGDIREELKRRGKLAS